MIVVSHKRRRIIKIMRTQQYNAGIYCRLSVDDGTDSESMSIGNQRQMLSEYVKKQGWNIKETYIDVYPHQWN